MLGGIIVPDSVAEELEAGRTALWDVPDVRKLSWITIRIPASTPALPLAAALGRG